MYAPAARPACVAACAGGDRSRRARDSAARPIWAGTLVSSVVVSLRRATACAWRPARDPADAVARRQALGERRAVHHQPIAIEGLGRQHAVAGRGTVRRRRRPRSAGISWRASSATSARLRSSGISAAERILEGGHQPARARARGARSRLPAHRGRRRRADGSAPRSRAGRCVPATAAWRRSRRFHQHRIARPGHRRQAQVQRFERAVGDHDLVDAALACHRSGSAARSVAAARRCRASGRRPCSTDPGARGRATARPSRSSGNSSGLGNAEPSGTTSCAIADSSTSNTSALTSTSRDSPSGAMRPRGSGGRRVHGYGPRSSPSARRDSTSPRASSR